MDGRDPLSADATFEKIVGQMRQDRQPAIVVMNVERLDNHTNADDQRTYRSAEDIDKIRSTADPILNLKTALLQGGKTEEELDEDQNRYHCQAQKGRQRGPAQPRTSTRIWGQSASQSPFG
jgi:2-oxoisovalerate dehydrogenase E1 component